jgi:phospholipid N-methyltransferase
LRDHIEFFRQFRERFETTGAVAPSSRFLASAMTRPLRQAKKPVRVLEVGPGTGAVTRKIVTLLGPEDRFDLVELNEAFAALLQKRFEENAAYRRVAGQSRIHVCPIEEFPRSEPYDVIISGLPLNNFPCDLVRRIFDVFFQLLAPGGTLSYFEYMYVRSIKRRVSNGSERSRLTELDGILEENIRRHRIRRDGVCVNCPPAWVQHLRAPE